MPEENSKTKNQDKELEDFLVQSLPKIMVVGIGGSGNNTLARMNKIGIDGAELVAFNTDAQSLISSIADKKLLLGKKSTKGLGAGSNPEVGEKAAEESIEDIKQLLTGYDMVFITCGLGGGTGTGAAPVTAKVAKELGALTIGVVTLPFAVEGKIRIENALVGLEKLKKNVDTLIVIPNDKILEMTPNLPLQLAFQEVDKVLTYAVKGIVELVTKAGIINLDFADLKTVLSKGGVAMIGVGESTVDKPNDVRAIEATEAALTSPLLDIDISGAKKALINVIGGNDLTLKEAELVVETVASRIHEDAHIIWGAMIDENLAKKIVKVMVVISGATIPFLEGTESYSENTYKDEEPVDYGVAEI